MDNEIQLFHSDKFGDVRGAVFDGEAMIAAPDVAKKLGYRDAANMLRSLDDDEKGTHVVSTLGGDQRISFITESGFYRAVLQRKSGRIPDKDAKKRVEDFQRWVTHDVLPSIRKHGAYATPVTIDAIIADPQFGIRLLTELQDERTKREQLEAENDELRPKALFADAVAASDGTCLVGELAKMLRQNGVEVGQNRLFAMLREDGYLGKSGGNYNVPTQRAMELGLFRIKETAVTHSDGHVTINRTPKVTGKGQRYFVERYCTS